MKRLGKLDEVYDNLTKLLPEFEKTADRHILFQLGEVFRKLNREEEFKGLLLKYPRSRRYFNTGGYFDGGSTWLEPRPEQDSNQMRHKSPL